MRAKARAFEVQAKGAAIGQRLELSLQLLPKTRVFGLGLRDQIGQARHGRSFRRVGVDVRFIVLLLRRMRRVR